MGAAKNTDNNKDPEDTDAMSSTTAPQVPHANVPNGATIIAPYNWVDITKEFQSSVQDLELGELLHDSLFGLFEAMSAIEMMDPKMDAGMLCNRGNKKAKTFEQSVEDGSLQLKNISNADLIGIIDTTLACMVSWLEGHSLAQTVFTNLYLHKPYLIENCTLKAFCIAVYKLLDIIKDYIHKAMVYEEEDFQAMQYGYYLYPDISEQRVVGMLHEVEEELHRETCALYSQEDKRGSERVEEIVAIYSRIKFIRVLYQTLMLFVHKRDEYLAVTPEVQKLIRGKLKLASDLIFVVIKTTHMGTQPESENATIMGFEPLINQRLLPPTFPRYTKIKPRTDALHYFENMIERFKVLSNIHMVTALNQALDFFIEFSKTSPCILSRSALQLLYVGSYSAITNTNVSVLKDILKDAAKQFISPPALTTKSMLYNQQARPYVDTFFTHCTRAFASFLQLCGHNRARQRDKLAHLLEEFTSLQDEAERVDAYLHNMSSMAAQSRPHLACFGTWILYHTLRIMIMYLLSGFELELYSVHEFYYIYWYLYEFLYGWLVSALTRADSFLAEQELINELQKNKGVNKKKNKLNKKRARPYLKESIYYQALQNMCGGYYKALMGFRIDGKLQMPHPEFDNERVRYDHRFAPFQNLLAPPPVHYPEFLDLTSAARVAATSSSNPQQQAQQQQQQVDSLAMYNTGYKHFFQARQLLESIQPADGEINELIRIAKTNFVVLKLLGGGHKRDSRTPPEFDFATNRHFPIIKLL